MSRLQTPYQHVELDLSTYDDAERHTLFQDLKNASTTSTLVLNDPNLQALLAHLATSDAALTTANTAVAADRIKLKTDLATEATARTTMDGDIRAFASLVERSAKTPADVQGAGMVPLPPRQIAIALPLAPDRFDVKIPIKGHGRLRVVVHETPGSPKGQYVAEWSPDPYGPTTWAQLGIGHGKSRWVSGQTGTKVWVRFARINARSQSDWSTPVLVTIP
jgi:hypothetical protein